MPIVDTETSQVPIEDIRFKIAAFMSFIYPILTIALIAVSSKQSAVLLFFRIPLMIVGFVFGVYTLLQFKRLLVERHQLHNMRDLMNFIIIFYICKFPIGLFMTIFPASVHLNMILGILLSILVAVITFIFGLKLLQEVKGLTLGLYRIYAILNIIDGVCSFTIILLPIGILLFTASEVVLGIIFLKESEAEAQVEFV